ncbi:MULTISPECIES: zinc uptake transcriptional repressor Zur [unclassified Vibrio]|uniref:Ferric uptake regulation protein n=1 Tax=Vibrio sp. HB236076 TaxID=3232307 RepID=A0AB39HFR4_9VIBR|nr:zinc uptake transcriptional repressor Zur [Vibrio sp. HB161653]MDP5254314.1 zinc uptake transcriptional repressor Zur [Vibrio sp. HB161653]
MVRVKILNHKPTEQIEQICQRRGVRLTPQRRAVFELICQSNKASSAYELLEQLQKSEPQAKPPTVYRALEFLLEQGFVHRVESTNSYISCCLSHESQHVFQLLICDRCGYVEELHDDSLTAQLNVNAKQHQFHLTKQVIESHGICQDCYTSEK